MNTQTHIVTHYENDYREWRNIQNQRHRTDGPAVEGGNGSREWWLNGQRHRTDGPAIERADGSREWWLNDVNLTEQEWRVRVNAEPRHLAEIERLYIAAIRERNKMSEELLAVTAERDALLKKIKAVIAADWRAGGDGGELRALVAEMRADAMLKARGAL